MWIGFVCLIVFYLSSVLWAFLELKQVAKEEPKDFIEYFDGWTLTYAIFTPIINFMCAYVLMESRCEHSQKDKKWIKKIFKI